MTQIAMAAVRCSPPDAQRQGRFLVVGGLPEGVNENYVYEYDRNFKFVKKQALASGHTHLGIQTAAFADGH